MACAGQLGGRGYQQAAQGRPGPVPNPNGGKATSDSEEARPIRAAHRPVQAGLLQLTDLGREFLDLPDAAQLGFVFAAWARALWSTALAPLAMLGAVDIPASMRPTPAWFALTSTAPALVAAAAAMTGPEPPPSLATATRN